MERTLSCNASQIPCLLATHEHLCMQGMVSMIVGIARQEGVRGLFRGLGPTVITNAPYSAFYYLFYTSLKERLQQVSH